MHEPTQLGDAVATLFERGDLPRVIEDTKHGILLVWSDELVAFEPVGDVHDKARGAVLPAWQARDYPERFIPARPEDAERANLAAQVAQLELF